MARKSRLPVKSTNSVEAAPAMPKEYEARERKYKAEEGLRTLQKAEECRKDKELMRDIKQLAKDQMKVVSK